PATDCRKRRRVESMASPQAKRRIRSSDGCLRNEPGATDSALGNGLLLSAALAVLSSKSGRWFPDTAGQIRLASVSTIRYLQRIPSGRRLAWRSSASPRNDHPSPPPRISLPFQEKERNRA